MAAEMALQQLRKSIIARRSIGWTLDSESRDARFDSQAGIQIKEMTWTRKNVLNAKQSQDTMIFVRNAA